MGLNIGYYVLEDSQIERLIGSGSDFDEVLNEELLMFHEYKSIPFWKNQMEFGQGVKAWNPMFELLVRIDKTTDKILSEPLAKIMANDYEYLVVELKDIDTVWSGLKLIAISDLEEALNDKDLKKSIKNVAGYRMENIDCPDLILVEYMELINAFYIAHQGRKKIVIKIE